SRRGHRRHLRVPHAAQLLRAALPVHRGAPARVLHQGRLRSDEEQDHQDPGVRPRDPHAHRGQGGPDRPRGRIRGETMKTLTYEVTGPTARVTLNRPARANGITFEMARELAECVEAANLDPAVHVIALAGNGAGFCGGYDLVIGAEQALRFESEE